MKAMIALVVLVLTITNSLASELPDSIRAFYYGPSYLETEGSSSDPSNWSFVAFEAEEAGSLWNRTYLDPYSPERIRGLSNELYLANEAFQNGTEDLPAVDEIKLLGEIRTQGEEARDLILSTTERRRTALTSDAPHSVRTYDAEVGQPMGWALLYHSGSYEVFRKSFGRSILEVVELGKQIERFNNGESSELPSSNDVQNAYARIEAWERVVPELLAQMGEILSLGERLVPGYWHENPLTPTSSDQYFHDALNFIADSKRKIEETVGIARQTRIDIERGLASATEPRDTGSDEVDASHLEGATVEGGFLVLPSNGDSNRAATTEAEPRGEPRKVHHIPASAFADF